jgi:4-carboxymuconolactone decarboxylase
MAPRIAPPEALAPNVEAILAKTLRTDSGRPFNVFTTLARHPRLLKRFNALGGLFMAHGELPARDRELVILRVAWRTGSVYEWGQHDVIGRRVGLVDDDIARLTGLVSDPAWSPHDSALLVLADQLIDNNDVDDAAWEAVASDHTDEQVLELLMLIGFYRMLAGVLNAVRVPLDDGLPGWPAAAAEASRDA